MSNRSQQLLQPQQKPKQRKHHHHRQQQQQHQQQLQQQRHTAFAEEEDHNDTIRQSHPKKKILSLGRVSKRAVLSSKRKVRLDAVHGWCSYGYSLYTWVTALLLSYFWGIIAIIQPYNMIPPNSLARSNCLIFGLLYFHEYKPPCNDDDYYHGCLCFCFHIDLGLERCLD